MELKNDELRRENFLNRLFSFFEMFGNNEDSGLTISINGRYGIGKTTLIDFIKEKNECKSNEFNIVTYDAWEGNIFDNPLIPLMYNISKLPTATSPIKKVALDVVKSIPKIALNTLANIHKVDLSPLLENKDAFSEYKDFEKAVEKCKNELTTFCNSKKTILLVDELDRCLPEYQIKVLETLYHFLNIPKLIIVLMLDVDQLEESVRNQFGRYIDANGYLTKFIQYQIEIPVEDTYNYAERLMTFKCDELQDTKYMIACMLKELDLSTRDVKNFTQKLNLICNERDNRDQISMHPYFYPILVSFMLLLKIYNRKIYNTFFKNIDNDYLENKIKYKESKFYRFMDNIKGEKFGNIFNVIKSSTSYVPLMLHIISLFENVKNIDIASLGEYLDSSSEKIDSIINYNINMNLYYGFPRQTNRIVDQLKIIC